MHRYIPMQWSSNKRVVMLLFALFLSLICVSALADVEINETNFPDANFRQYIIDSGFDTDGNGTLSDEEIGNVTKINCDEKSITDLTGIENFTALKELECFDNELTSLDVSQNSALTRLNCSWNQLISLDVSGCVELEWLSCSGNELTSLDISQNMELSDLSCAANQLTSLDVSQNIALTNLTCSSNELTSLDVNQNTALTYLSCSANQLTSLDVSECPALTELYCAYSQLTTLDVSKNTALENLHCDDDQLTSLDVTQNTSLKELWCHSNQLTSLDVSRNTALTNLRCSSNQLTTLDLTNNTKLLEEIAKSVVDDRGEALRIGYSNEDSDYMDHLVLEIDFTVTVLPEGTVSYVIPEKSDNIATSLTGVHNVSVKVGETIGLKTSDYQLYPEGSLINGRGTIEESSVGFNGWNRIFSGRGDIYWEEGSLYITPNTPGYYSLQAYARYYDKYAKETAEVRSDILILTVLNEDGSEPELGELKTAIFPFAGATVGETVQINWSQANFMNPGSCVIRIEKDGNVLDQWDYAEIERDTYTVTAVGDYDVYITLTDAMNRTITSHTTLTVTEPKPLEIKNLTLATEDIIGNTDGTLYWFLESEGGYGDKKTDVYLVHVDTGEEEDIITDEYRVAWTQHNVEYGTYYIRMNVKDDQGDHWIESNKVTLGSGIPAWDFFLPTQLKVIEAEAFEGISASAVYIPAGATTIETAAFRNSKIQAVYIPSSVTSIAEDAIPAGAIIYTADGSFAHTWAVEHGYTVETR